MVVIHSSKYGVATKMAWGKAGSDTATTVVNTLTVSDITANDTFQTISHIVKSSSGNYGIYARYNDVSSGSLYHGRYETNGTTDQTYQGNGIYYMLENSGGTAISAGDFFNVSYQFNIETEEKFTIGDSVLSMGTGSGTAPNRNQFVGKLSNTTDLITSVKHFDEYGTQYAIDSNLSVLGSDMTPAPAVTFPSDVPDYTRAEITDTRKMYTLTPATTLNTSDDFSSSSGWTQVTNTNFGVISGELIGNSISSGTNGAGVWKDYGLVFDDEKFVFRCKFQIVTQSGQTGNASTVYFGISDTNGATSPSGNRDGFGIAITNYAASGMLWLYPDGTTWDNADTDLSLSPSANTYYLEIKRTSATSVTFTLYSDSTFTTVVKTHTQSIASTLDGLRYVMMQEWRNGSTNTTKIAVDDLKVYNGVSSVSAGGWKEKGTT